VRCSRVFSSFNVNPARSSHVRADTLRTLERSVTVFDVLALRSEIPIEEYGEPLVQMPAELFSLGLMKYLAPLRGFESDGGPASRQNRWLF